MKTAKLEMLEIELPLRRLQEYHDEGFVKTLYDGLAKLSDEYGDHTGLLQLEFLRLSGKKIPRAGAFPFYREANSYRERHVHILYEDQGSEIMNINCRAHEETHAIILFGEKNLRVLERAIASNGFSLRTPLSKINLDTIAKIGVLDDLLKREDTKEDIQRNLPTIINDTIAKIGGLYALLKRGYSEEEIRRNLPIYLTRELALIERK